MYFIEENDHKFAKQLASAISTDYGISIEICEEIIGSLMGKNFTETSLLKRIQSKLLEIVTNDFGGDLSVDEKGDFVVYLSSEHEKYEDLIRWKNKGLLNVELED